MDFIEVKPNVWVIEKPPIELRYEEPPTYRYEESKAGSQVSPTTDWGEILSSVLAEP